MWIVPEEFGLFGYILCPINSSDFSEFKLYSVLDGTYSFNANGKPTKISENNSQAFINLYYNSQNQISELQDESGRTYKVFYTEHGLIREIRILDANQQLLQVKTNTGETVDYIFKYVYDNQQQLIEVIYPDKARINYSYQSGNIVTISNVDGRVFQIEYDGARVKRVSQITNDSSKLLLEIARTPNGILLSDQYCTDVEKNFDAISPTKIKQAGENYLRHSKWVSSISMALSSLKAVSFSSDTQTNVKKNQNNSQTDLYLKSIEPSYNFEEDSGLITSITDAYKNQTQLYYDASRNLVEMSAYSSSGGNEVSTQYHYENDVLHSISHNGFNYNLLYDEWGNNAGINIQNRPYVLYSYKDGKSELCEKESYGNGQSVQYYYDDSNRLVGISTDNGQSLQYKYDYDNSSLVITQESDGTLQKYTEQGLQVIDKNTGQLLMNITAQDNVQLLNINGLSSSLSFTVNEDQNSGIEKASYNFSNGDLISQLTVEKGNHGFVEYSSLNSNNEQMETYIDYWRGQNYTTAQIKNFATEYSNNSSSLISQWKYTYDANGRISDIAYNHVPYAHYVYDEIGQLIKAENYKLGQTTIYQYDSGGNVTQKTILSDTTTRTIEYLYGDSVWRDKLTSYDGAEILYDEIGNPISYKGCTYTWSKGRNLQEFTNDQYIIQYQYDEMNRRQTKTVYDKISKEKLYQYRFFWGNSLIIAYTVTDYTGEQAKTDVVSYQYDNEMNIYSFVVNNKDTYFYEKNALGDIVGVYCNGEKIADYQYDEAGNIHINSGDERSKKYNLLYYRGYMYDLESNLYYLQSRYYSPEWGRFINADIYADTGTGLLGTNMFLYCDNDPINKIDPTGFWGKDTHEKITRNVLNEAGLDDKIAFNVDQIVAGNRNTDDRYSAIIIIPSYQGRHFDRHIRISEANGTDTRAYYSGTHLSNAIDAYHANDRETMNTQIGYALHCMQDYSSHGNIDVNTWEFASHAFITGVDDPAYD